jgi:methyltransferase family protein
MTETPDQIKADIKQRFVKLALAPQKEQKFPVGPTSAKRLGYDPHEIDILPLAVTESFAGVGNPLALGELHVGQTVLDLGSGAGLDSILAARRLGPTGKVIGVDFAASTLRHGQPPGHGRRVVRRMIVDHEDVQVAMSLAEQRSERPRQLVRFVSGRYDRDHPPADRETRHLPVEPRLDSPVPPEERVSAPHHRRHRHQPEHPTDRSCQMAGPIANPPSATDRSWL